MMPTNSTSENPEVLSYKALRQAVGWVALALPFALIIPWAIGGHELPTSISAYYYTGMRNLFVGSLCAVGLFNFCCRGYDWRDVAAGIFSAVCAVCVAFFPTSPSGNLQTPPCPVPGPHHEAIGTAHYVFAAMLFLTLAYFCLGLFTKTAVEGNETPKKLRRNRVYRVCGIVILVSIFLIALFGLLHRTYLFGNLGAMFCFETSALVAFGIAWLVKGETFAFIRDEPLQGQWPRPVL